MNLTQLILNETLLIRRNLYNEITDNIKCYFNEHYDTNDLIYLNEGELGHDFYNSIATKGFKKNTLITVRLPVDLMTSKAKEKIKNVNKSMVVETQIPVDLSNINKIIKEYVHAKKENVDLYNKYKIWSDWYNDFNKLIFDSLSESDACLFLAATTFASANTAIDVNILEASKLFMAVKTDFKRGNAGRRSLEFIANNINSIDSQKNVNILYKLASVNSSYAQLLAPKHDANFVKSKSHKLQQVKEITVSGSKLKSYNFFVKYYLEHNGKLTKKQILSDLQSGKIKIGGTKIYSFFINLIDPEFEWESMDGVKIQPTTIDRWMIKLFFNKSIEKLISELQHDNIVPDDNDTTIKLSSKLIFDIFSSDDVSKTIVKIMNDLAKKMDMKSNELQAFVWVKFREDSGVTPPRFSSFRDVMNFVDTLEQRIDKINPELSFIKNIGLDVKKDTKSVLSTIALLTKIPRWTSSKEEEIEKMLKNWRQFYPEYTLDNSTDDKIVKNKKINKKSVTYYVALSNINEVWIGKIRLDKKDTTKILKSIKGKSFVDVINKSKKWIHNHVSDEVIMLKLNDNIMRYMIWQLHKYQIKN